MNFAVNNAYKDSIKTTPFLLNCGQNPRVAAQPFSKVRNCPSAEKMNVQMQQDLQAAKECLKGHSKGKRNMQIATEENWNLTWETKCI